MKKTIFLGVLILIAQNITAQCDTFTVPYTLDVENAIVPQLPDCANSEWDSFSSQKEFESSNESIDGLEGKVLAYDTFAQSSGVPSHVSVKLTSYTIQFEEGVEYVISYKYKFGNANASIDYLSLQLLGTQGNNVHVSVQQNIVSPTATSFVSGTFTVPSTGEYRLFFTLTAQPNQGLFYMDDITVYESGAMDLEDKSLSSIVIYPNPVSNLLTINNEQNIDKLEIYTLSGQLVYNQQVNNLSCQINVSNLPIGIYILNICSGDAIKKMKIYKD